MREKLKGEGIMKLTKLFKKSEIKQEKDDLIARMRNMDPSSKEYTFMLGLVERLDTLEHKKQVSPDTIVTGMFILIEMGAIMHYEQLGVITTKAFQRLSRWRV